MSISNIVEIFTIINTGVIPVLSGALFSVSANVKLQPRHHRKKAKLLLLLPMAGGNFARSVMKMYGIRKKKSKLRMPR